MSEIEGIESIKVAQLTHPRIQLLNEKDDFAYLRAIEELQNYPQENKQFGKDLQIVLFKSSWSWCPHFCPQLFIHGDLAK